MFLDHRYVDSLVDEKGHVPLPVQRLLRVAPLQYLVHSLTVKKLA